MAMPKSVVKVKKDGVEYISNVDRVQYTIEELTRAALRDTGKLLRKRVKDATPVRQGILKRNIATWLRKNQKTGESRLQIGVYNAPTSKKKKLTPAYHAHLLEFGTIKMQAANSGRGFLRATVQDSVDDIQVIQGKYLSAIEDENKAMGLIDESEDISDD